MRDRKSWRQVGHRVGRNVEEGRSYALVLLFVFISYFVMGIANGHGLSHVTVVLVEGLMLLMVLRVANAPRRAFLFGGGLWGVMLFAAIVGLWLGGSHDDLATPRLGSAIMIGFVIGVIGMNLARRKKVDGETVLGLISIYLLLGMFFAFLTLAVDTLEGGVGDYFIGKTEVEVSEFLFFSYVTLTTVGYGNLIPKTDLGQTLATFEAVCGTLFLILAIGRTISMVDADKRTKEEHALRVEIREQANREMEYLHDRLDAAGIPRPRGDSVPDVPPDDEATEPR